MKNVKVGMAINYDYPDYGGMLQAYASFRKIYDLGYKPETININAISKDIRNRKIKYFAKNIFDISIVKEKSRIIAKKIKTELNRDLKLNLNKRYAAFDKFYKEYFNISREYLNWKDLGEGCKNYSSVVVGSDQLWLPSNIAGDYYTLSFVPDEVNKIAYATSFGVSKLAERQKQIAHNYLERINYLSAREESGQKIIKESIGRDVQLVCDPALLLTSKEWDEVATHNKLIKEKYIFCYFMGDNPWQRSFAEKIKEKTGYKIVSLLHLDQYIKSDEDYVDYAPYNISPADFVNLVKYSEMVCTDSFHGTVFSLIYNKKFFTFMRFSENATLSTNSRITTLLKQVGAENRLILKDTAFEQCFEQYIDYDSIQEKIDNFRNKSLEYLIKALEKR